MSFSLLPIESFKIVTFKPKEDVVKVLSENIDREEEKRFTKIFTGTNSALFRGSIVSDIFLVKRKISYKNDFNPVLAGRIYNDGSKTFIEVRVQMEDKTMIFMGFWLLCCLCFIAVTALSEAPINVTIVAGCMFFAGYLIPMMAYAFELRKTKKLLLELVKGSISQST